MGGAPGKTSGQCNAGTSRRPWTVVVGLAAAAAISLPALVACATTPSPCEAAFQSAAQVPAGQTNDAEMLLTVKVCDGQEWHQQLVRHPMALGVSAVTTQNEIAAQELLCSRVSAGENQMCDLWNRAMGRG